MTTDVVLTDAQIAVKKRAGWSVLPTSDDRNYKLHWDSPWYIIREVYQNALDEHDEAGVKELPVIGMGAKGVFIEDKGRGIGSAAMVKREIKSATKDLRGNFGEGLKYATIVALRMGYLPLIESQKLTIQAYLRHQVVAGDEYYFVTYFYKDTETPRVGTRVTLQGYKGDMYKNNFVAPNAAALSTTAHHIGRFNRTGAILTERQYVGKLFVGDIFVREFVEKTKYGYNLWGVPLNPDRVSEIDTHVFRNAMGILWSYAFTPDVIKAYFKAIDDPSTVEYDLRYYNGFVTGNQSLWLATWESLFGKRGVLFTSILNQKYAEGYGYKVVGASWAEETRNFLAAAIPTDKQVVDLRVKEITKPEIIPDAKLSLKERQMLDAIRFLNAEWGKKHNREAASVTVAIIPPDPRTKDIFEGLCARSEKAIYLTRGVFISFEYSLSIYYHELGHWLGGIPAKDGTIEHTKAVHEGAASVTLIMDNNRDKLAEIFGLRPVETKREVVEIVRKTEIPIKRPDDLSWLLEWEPPATFTKTYWAAWHSIGGTPTLSPGEEAQRAKLLELAAKKGYLINPDKGHFDRHIRAMNMVDMRGPLYFFWLIGVFKEYA